MKFKLIPNARGTNDLEVTAETLPEINELGKHCRIEASDLLPALMAGTMVQVLKASARDNGSWFACEYELEPKFIAPYLARLSSWVGPVEFHDLDLPPHGYGWKLCPTHMVERCWIDGEAVFSTGFIHSTDWDGKTAAQRAPRHFAEYRQEWIGQRPTEPEYIRIGNGLLKENPNYLRRRPVDAGVTNEFLLAALWQHWLDHCASSAQVDVATRALECVRTVTRDKSYATYAQRSREDGMRLGWGAGDVVSWEDFRKLGA